MISRVSLALIPALLAGCAHPAPPPPPTPKTPCEAVAALLGNQFATPGQIAVAMEVGRNRGCFGPSQPKTVIVR